VSGLTTRFEPGTPGLFFMGRGAMKAKGKGGKGGGGRKC